VQQNVRFGAKTSSSTPATDQPPTFDGRLVLIESQGKDDEIWSNDA
jgi:hypothetical protein